MNNQMLKDLAKDLWKLIVVGGVSWIISSGWTTWRLQPERNISIIPLTAVRKQHRKGDYCNVNHDSLANLLESDGGSAQKRNYLEVLMQSKGPVIMNKLAREIMKENPSIFDCKSDLRPLPATTYNAALIMSEDETYLIEKKCRLNTKLQDDEVMVPLSINTPRNESPFPVTGTQLIELSYDLSRDEAASQNRAPFATIAGLEQVLQQAEGADDNAGREVRIGLQCSATYKRPWFMFWAADNSKKLESGREKIRVVQASF